MPSKTSPFGRLKMLSLLLHAYNHIRTPSPPHPKTPSQLLKAFRTSWRSVRQLPFSAQPSSKGLILKTLTTSLCGPFLLMRKPYLQHWFKGTKMDSSSWEYFPNLLWKRRKSFDQEGALFHTMKLCAFFILGGGR